LLRAEIETAALLANFVRGVERNIKLDQTMIGYVEATSARVATGGGTRLSPDVMAFEDHQHHHIDDIRGEQTVALESYRQFVRKIADDSAGQDVPGIADLVRQEMENRGQKKLKNFLPLVTQHVAAAHADRLPSSDQMRSQLVAVPDASPG